METTQPALGGSPFNLQGGGELGFCRAQMIYFNPARRRAENVNTCLYMFV